MIWLYRLAFLPALLVALPYYLGRMWRRGGYRKDFGHRFGCMRGVPSKRPGVHRIWLQAVSVGELLALEPLLKRLAEDPAVEVCLTTTTSTGRLLAESKYAALTIWRGVFPLDWVLPSAAAWRHLDPDLAVLMESELWPEHLHQAHRRKVPVVLLNARLSDRSFHRYERLGELMRPFLLPLTHILAASPEDADRFRALQLPTTRIERMGNLKFDTPLPPPLSPEEWATLRAEVGVSPEELLLVGASTWPGEEVALIEAAQAARDAGLPVKLLITPRHAERRRELERVFTERSWSVHWRTDAKKAPPDTQVYMADTTGELSRFVQLADLAFIGKTLPPHTEGQTPIEAAGHGKAILLGPGFANFRRIVQTLLAGKAAVCVDTPEALSEAVSALLADVPRRAELGAAAQRLHRAGQGAATHAYDVLESFWKPSS